MDVNGTVKCECYCIFARLRSCVYIYRKKGEKWKRNKNERAERSHKVKPKTNQIV